MKTNELPTVSISNQDNSKAIATLLYNALISRGVKPAKAIQKIELIDVISNLIIITHSSRHDQLAAVFNFCADELDQHHASLAASAASELGKVKSPAKAKSSARNGKLGGRPVKNK